MKAQFVFENVEFHRGGREAMDKVFKGPPIGSLFKWGGRFPYIVILVGRTDDPNKGIIQQIGAFRGGGRKKTEFRFYTPKNKERYKLPYDAMRSIPEKLWDMLKNKAKLDPFDRGTTYWERFEEETGVKPILPVYESIRFERGASDADIKRELRNDGPFQPGEIVVRDLPNDPHTKKLHVYVDYDPKGFLAPHKAYSFGTIDRYNGKASFIHNTQNKTGMAGLQDNEYLRRVTRDEAKEIRKALNSGRYDRYIEECKKKTGLTPFV